MQSSHWPAFQQGLVFVLVPIKILLLRILLQVCCICRAAEQPVHMASRNFVTGFLYSSLRVKTHSAVPSIPLPLPPLSSTYRDILGPFQTHENMRFLCGD